MTAGWTTFLAKIGKITPPAIPYGCALFITAALGTTAFAQSMPEGRYKGQYGSDGVLSVDVTGTTARVSVGRPGCLGEMTGSVTAAGGGSWAVTTTEYGSCTLTMTPANGGYAITQGPGCMIYHGAACNFSGTVEKAS